MRKSAGYYWRTGLTTGLTTGLIAAVVSLPILAILACPGKSFAADKNWTAAVSGSFDDGTKWTPFGWPGWMDNAIFNVPGTYTVSAGTEQLAGLEMLQGNVTLNFASPGSLRVTPQESNPNVYVGANDGTSSLVFDGGDSSFLTDQFDGVDSLGNHWVTTPDIFVGGGGVGILTFQNGASAPWLRSHVSVGVGGGGGGSLNVLSGASVLVN